MSKRLVTLYLAAAMVAGLIAANSAFAAATWIK
jgi:hypothetical protein